MNRNIIFSMLFSIFVFIFISGCDVVEVYEYDHTRPEITITYPPNEAVIGENGVTVKVEASDNEGVTRVEFYLNALHDSTGDDANAPYEYLLKRPDSVIVEDGTYFTLFAKAFDARKNEMISNFVPLYYNWRPLINDRDEEMNSNIDRVLVRSTSSSLEFQITTYDDWRNVSDSTGLNCAFFLDTDQNSQTGHHTTQIPPDPVHSFLGNGNPAYVVNNIGPEYAIILGSEGNRLYRWDESSLNWHDQESLNFIDMKSDTNVAALGVALTALGNPQVVDVVVARITYADSTYWDWAPDTSHVEYNIDGLYINE